MPLHAQPNPALSSREISGPILDRIDIHVHVPMVEFDKLLAEQRAESSLDIRKRVESARARQVKRFEAHPGLFANADMTVGEIDDFCVLNEEARQILALIRAPACI